MQIKKYANVTIEFPTGREEEELLRLDESALSKRKGGIEGGMNVNPVTFVRGTRSYLIGYHQPQCLTLYFLIFS
jgi:hypothetical protein